MILYDPKIIVRVYEGTTGKDVEGLGIDFSVTLTDGEDPNKATIRVHGMQQSSRSLFADEYQNIELYAGYTAFDPHIQVEPALVFKGNIVNVSNIRDPQDKHWITVIEAADGIKEYQTSIFSKTYPKGTTYEFIMREVAGQMGLPIRIDGLLSTDITSTSETYDSLAKDVMNNLCRDKYLSWSIQYGTVEVKYRGDISGTETTRTATLISEKTGMIDSPVMVIRTDEEGKKKNKKKEKQIWAVQVTSMLVPGLRPGSIVKIESSSMDTQATPDDKSKLVAKVQSNISHYCVVRSVTYIGNNVSGQYQMMVDSDLINDDIR